MMYNDKSDSKPSRAQRVFFRARDLLFLAIVLAIALTFFLLSSKDVSGSSLEAHVYIDGELVDRIVLQAGVDKDYSYASRPTVQLHQYADQTVAVIVSDCPDKTCINTGRIGKPGAFVACVPNRFLVTIVATEMTDTTQEVDVVT
ncbi:MAG: NusG domain II-containing protein [Clostridiaceae bacterium]|jgi:hypothetical protein|nr:NusG domain II-containing protein [Clostridiaceae bacterium]